MGIKWLRMAVGLLVIPAQLCWSLTDGESAGGKVQPRLRVHLPEEVTVEGENLTLGRVALVTGEGPLVAKASEVGLGRIALAGQKITIDRSLILSRLACSGLAAEELTITGAEKVTVTQAARTVGSAAMIEAAVGYLKDNIKEQSIAGWTPLRNPEDFIIGGQAANVELSPRLLSGLQNGRSIVEVSIVLDGKPVGTRQIAFAARYNSHRAVTVIEVAAGQTITPQNTRIEATISDSPQSADWRAPYGLVTARALPAGIVISPGMVKPAQAEQVIERNQNVIIRVDRPGLLVTAVGKAMQPGRVGECIRVRNLDSQRVILARVSEDGTVEPVF